MARNERLLKKATKLVVRTGIRGGASAVKLAGKTAQGIGKMTLHAVEDIATGVVEETIDSSEYVIDKHILKDK